MGTPLFGRLLAIFVPKRIGWANAHRIADDHDAHVSSLESEAFEDFGDRLKKAGE